MLGSGRHVYHLCFRCLIAVCSNTCTGCGHNDQSAARVSVSVDNIMIHAGVPFTSPPPPPPSETVFRTKTAAVLPTAAHTHLRSDMWLFHQNTQKSTKRNIMNRPSVEQPVDLYAPINGPGGAATVKLRVRCCESGGSGRARTGTGAGRSVSAPNVMVRLGACTCVCSFC